MAPDAVPRSIADRVAQSLAAFEAAGAIETQAQPEESHVIWVEAIGDQLSKFKLWAGNIGAHRTGRSSLDYRLRDSSNLHTQVVRLLDDLINSLNEALSILSGERLPWDRDLGEADELDEELKDLLINEDFEFDSELGQLTKEIDDTIGRLLRLSISLRNPAPHDRFMSTEYAKVRYFEANDKAHVEAKFPQASQTLIVRLGQALSQRRQYFRYREAHHEKLARGLFDSGRSEAGAQSTVASSVPLAMKGPEAVPVFGELDEDERSDTGFSQTSFATTAPDSERLRIPPLPKRSYNGPFECPFCFMLISVSSTYQWKKHVLRDLRPYICLAEDCPAASKEYGRRHEWMNHMLQKHWKAWQCPYRCGLYDTTETNLREHLPRVHGLATQMELDAIIARCGQTRSPSSSSPIDCPLCQDTIESVQQYQRHVGRHQVDLALFALPKIYGEDEELDEHNDDQETISTRSGSYSEALSDDICLTALPEQTQSRDIGHEEEHEAGPRFSFERQPRGDYSADSQDGESSFDEDNDIIVRIRQRRDSQNRSPRLSYPGDSFVDNKRVDNFSDPGSDGDNNRASRGHEYGRAWGSEQSEKLRERAIREEGEMPELEQERHARQHEREAAQKEYELERAQKELEELKLVAKIEQEEKRREQTAREERELREAKEELVKKLDDVHEEWEYGSLTTFRGEGGLDHPTEEEGREKELKEAIERYKKEEAERALIERETFEKEAREAFELYKKQETERALTEKESREKKAREVLERYGKREAERAVPEMKISGNEKDPTNKSTEKEDNEEEAHTTLFEVTRPTYTRMSRRHLSLETLRVFDVDYVIDQNPDYVLIKRWVPEAEQDLLWKHTRTLARQRAGTHSPGRVSPTKNDPSHIQHSKHVKRRPDNQKKQET
ncbi:hypothetical protein GGR55DRAFT_692515 [Xylaria sp. FL0064]|nr:hypothetical protein GGR55DRAFT_692515 [Xylaria sp. FL0064]